MKVVSCFSHWSVKWYWSCIPNFKFTLLCIYSMILKLTLTLLGVTNQAGQTLMVRMCTLKMEVICPLVLICLDSSNSFPYTVTHMLQQVQGVESSPIASIHNHNTLDFTDLHLFPIQWHTQNVTSVFTRKCQTTCMLMNLWKINTTKHGFHVISNTGISS